MVRKVTPAQYKNMIRQAQNKQKQAIAKVNREIRQYNQKVKRSVENYNREVRAYNARVRANRQRLKSELQRLSRQSTSIRYTVYRTSVTTLQSSYSRLEERSNSEAMDPRYNWLIDLSEREAANSADVTNALLGSEDIPDKPIDELVDAELTTELQSISPDLDNRWKGAVFALNPSNPDAARHFCTSAREVIIQILEIKAPDENVFEIYPDCELTDKGNPTRRTKINYLLQRKELRDPIFVEFVDKDVENILELFRVFNDATHGSAGKYDLPQLSSIKKRVEDGIMFLSQIAG